MRIPLFKRNPSAARDPVCDMEVNPKNPNGGSYEHSGQTYYFCAPGCNRAFQKDPEAYLSGEKKIRM